ncbi:BREX-2 system adenine-specific DNA-methyltransferase PglX [Nocardiopsis tropica]|uniref:site-specific DNA-methyltransferase (adenine-specific) n=1 Tax=Nocardiopsis tropica TaxID=109330 RepID=A0ABU7KI91_9ACTN|nr:BREX-2 system adenine-specific DNA-methyltransferase PglX [Nocardiopsis umidischolae]MEE2049015.1 BREX-2 system adenine-specific DNA-methyltransferase PglX [Nocardiopsis umidischolae]
MIDRAALLDDLKRQVKGAESDLAAQVREIDEVGTRLRGEYNRASKLNRTAATWNAWLDERITQVAVAWVLGTVFVRFAEDNRLIPEPYLTAPEIERRDLAEARYSAYVETDEDPTYRGWLERSFAGLGAGRVGKLLFHPEHNPLFHIPLSHDGARDLVEFWRERDSEGVLVHDFTDPLNEDGTEGWDTRFLGDLYQDLSENARKTYALLQTPEFVEEFILDRTMTPAVREFGYRGLKMIDPTCGSGHFVLGVFKRLVKLHAKGQPGGDAHEQVRAALDSVHGVDINPFAVAIARFRLLVAAMAAANIRTFAEAGRYDWPMHLAVGDSLIKARQLELVLETADVGDSLASFAYATEDVHEHKSILEQGRYHVVVGNPPYIQVADPSLNKAYREAYSACAGGYALSVPFAQRFFELAKRGDNDGRGYGMVGQITANSFMKREFGAKLVEDFFAHQVELTEVIDTSGAYIPGHGTPTVILVGTRRRGKERSRTVRTVRSVQGEPSAPENAEDGLVWRSIVEQINDPGSIGQWVSVDDLERHRYFKKQPWILVDGGLEMVEQFHSASAEALKNRSVSVGRTTSTGADDIFIWPDRATVKRNGYVDRVRPMVVGEVVRDFSFNEYIQVGNPYADDKNSCLLEASDSLVSRHLWLDRTRLRKRKIFGKTLPENGRPWYVHLENYSGKMMDKSGIGFAFVATHNHFVFDREGLLFNRTAPVIKLRNGLGEEEFLRLLGVLNSSAACFWLKMVSHDKGNRGGERGTGRYAWESFFEFTGTKLEEFPLPPEYPAELGAALDHLAQQLAASSPIAAFADATPTAATLRESGVAWELIRKRMIFLQEELDWQVYSLYNLHDEDLRVPSSVDIREIALGERAFEIVLARRVAAGEASGEWFKRHGSTPITEIPAHWPEEYRQVVQKRIDVMESSRAIGMVERPEYKRRWATEGWDSLQDKALRSWLLDRMEAREHWYDDNDQPALLTLSQLVDALSRDEDFTSVARIYAPRQELADVVAALVTDEHVPFVSALRYKPSGLKKRADWERTWELQREEDAAPDEPAKRRIRDSIKVPPKYTSADFLRASFWKARGKLDVPKERFISYGSTNNATPDLYGWAGWDHREQAQALASYVSVQVLSAEEITPFLAGLLELQPWLGQWHDEFDAMYGSSPAGFFSGYRQQLQGEHGLTDDDLREWRPVAATRGRRGVKKK